MDAGTRAYTRISASTVFLLHNAPLQTVHLITGVFTASNAAQASLFLGTLEALLGTPAGEEEEEGPDACGAERDSRTAERCGVYLGPWKRLLRSLVMSEREWLETEKALASSQAGGRVRASAIYEPG